MKIFILTLFSIWLFVSGCAINRYNDPLVWHECKKLEQLKETYNYDFSTKDNHGTLLIFSQPASMQMAVKNYQFNIGGNKITAFKYSDTKILLDPGEYIITGKVNFFGLTTSKKIIITSDEETSVIFRGPMDMFSKGIFWDAENK